MTFKKKIKLLNILKWVLLPWAIIQNIVGFGCWIYNKILGQCDRKVSDEGIVYFEVSKKSATYGVSLGNFIFLNLYYQNKIDIRHETGHMFQNLCLGPFYLFIIGIPSGAANIPWLSKILYGRRTHTNYEYYNNLFQEAWADKWGGILHSGDSSSTFKRYVNPETETVNDNISIKSDTLNNVCGVLTVVNNFTVITYDGQNIDDFRNNLSSSYTVEEIVVPKYKSKLKITSSWNEVIELMKYEGIRVLKTKDSIEKI